MKRRFLLGALALTACVLIAAAVMLVVIFVPQRDTVAGRTTTSHSGKRTAGQPIGVTPSGSSGTTTDASTGQIAPEQRISRHGVLISVLIVVVLTLTALTAVAIEFRRRLRDITSLVVNLHACAVGPLNGVVRDLTPLAGVPSRVQRISERLDEIASGIQRLQREVASLQTTLGSVKDRLRGRSDETTTPWPVEPVNTNPNQRRAEDEDESVDNVLRQLASDCVQSPMTQLQVRARVKPGWTVNPFGDSELPDAFVIDVGSRDAWFVPNTRRWSTLRHEGLFDVTGPDLPTAQIVRVDTLPRVRRVGSKVQLASNNRGRLEISIA